MELPEVWPEEMMSKVRNLVGKTAIEDTEFSSIICHNGKEFILGETCKGSRCSAKITYSCPPGFRPIGVFHTHPRAALSFSSDDLRLGELKSEDGDFVMCLGAAGQHVMLCSLFSHGKIVDGKVYDLGTGREVRASTIARDVGFHYMNEEIEETARGLREAFKMLFSKPDESVSAAKLWEWSKQLSGSLAELLMKGNRFCSDLNGILGDHAAYKGCIEGILDSFWMKWPEIDVAATYGP